MSKRIGGEGRGWGACLRWRLQGSFPDVLVEEKQRWGWESVFSTAAQVILIQVVPGNTLWEILLVIRYLYSLVRKDWKFDPSWWMLPDDWFSSGGWRVSDTLFLQLPYCRLGGPQWFVSAAAVRWSGRLQSFGIQVCRTDRNGGRQS